MRVPSDVPGTIKPMSFRIATTKVRHVPFEKWGLSRQYDRVYAHAKAKPVRVTRQGIINSTQFLGALRKWKTDQNNTRLFRWWLCAFWHQATKSANRKHGAVTISPKLIKILFTQTGPESIIDFDINHRPKLVRGFPKKLALPGETP